MKNIKYTYTKFAAFIAFTLLITTVSCERDLSDEAVFATFSTDGDVFIDNFSSGLDYFPFVDAGADAFAFTVETNEVFSGSASMRFDVPAFGNGFVGATFNTTGNRDLSGYDALTFYAKASQAATVNAIGFGISGETANKHQVELNNLEVTTNWKKYVIPIPDASKLISETGLFWLAEGASFEGDEGGYVLWFDEVRFERLGTVAQPNPKIFNGNDVTEQSFEGSTLSMSGLTQTFNLESGENVTVIAAPSYFDFLSTDIEIARVSERGEISVVAEGTAEITALLGGVLAEGSLTINSGGGLEPAPNPTLPESSVTSILSDSYSNIVVDFYNGNFEGQATEGGLVNLGDNTVLTYTNLDFVTIQFLEQTIDVSDKTMIHFDIFIQESIDNSDQLRVELVNDANNDGALAFGQGLDNGGSSTISGNSLNSGEWVGIDLPLDSFNSPTGGDGFTGGIANRVNLASLTFASGGISSITVDNIYFYSN